MRELTCRRCLHTWVPRQEEVRICPKCKSAWWDRPAPEGHELLGIALRENQAETIEAIRSAFTTGGKHTVFLDAPVGSGKSLVNMAAANVTAQTAYLTTPQTLLVDQYKADTDPGGKFEVFGARTVKGRANYPCPYVRGLADGDADATAEAAPCTFLKHWPGGCGAKHGDTECTGCPEYSRCPYYIAKHEAMAAPITITTMAYFILGIERSPNWLPRPLLIIDEAHGLPESLVEFFSVSVREKTFPGIEFKRIPHPDLTQPIDEGLPYLLRELPSYIQRQEETLKRLIDAAENHLPPSDEDMKAISSQKRLVDRCHRVHTALTTAGVEWIHTYDTGSSEHKWRPVDIAPFMEDIWESYDHVLLSSATFFDPATLVRSLGLPASWAVVPVPDTFPAERARVHLVGSVHLNRDRMDAELPKVLEELVRIAALHPDERGVIHCNSYKVKNYIDERLKELPEEFRGRVAFHGRGKDRNDGLNRWLQDGRANSIFVAVSMSEGLDLVGDQARWQVIIKAPYPNLGDPWVLRRKARGDNWYPQQAVTNILQSCGRVMRSKDDRGVTYILDRSATALLSWNWKDLPAWFRSRASQTSGRPS